jgi:hypothetical protein
LCNLWHRSEFHAFFLIHISGCVTKQLAISSPPALVPVRIRSRIVRIPSKHATIRAVVRVPTSGLEFSPSRISSHALLILFDRRAARPAIQNRVAVHLFNLASPSLCDIQLLHLFKAHRPRRCQVAFPAEMRAIRKNTPQDAPSDEAPPA